MNAHPTSSKTSLPNQQQELPYDANLAQLREEENTDPSLQEGLTEKELASDEAEAITPPVDKNGN